MGKRDSDEGKGWREEVVRGMLFATGMVIVLALVVGAFVFAVGFHSASDIVSGVFQGNYTFNGSINLSNKVYYSDASWQNTSQGLVLLQKQIVSSSVGNVTFTGINSNYQVYIVEFNNLTTQTDDVEL